MDTVGCTACGDDATWWAPSVGEEVLLLSPGGNLEQAVVICSMYSADAPPQSTNANQRVTAYASGGRVVVDKSNNAATLSGFDTISASASQSIVASAPSIEADASQSITASAPTIKAVATTSITLDTPVAICTGSLEVKKGFTAGSGGGGETAVFKSPVDFQGATVSHAGVNIGNTHVHSGVETGAERRRSRNER
ncbi:hypothetical protein CEQ28_023205 [Hafnia alvei]|nr:hypothetical protein CEQ28_023205 [Hafnia alvei]